MSPQTRANRFRFTLPTVFRAGFPSSCRVRGIIRVPDPPRVYVYKIQEGTSMLTSQALRELHTAWFPNMTDAGLTRLIELLEQSSPLLIHGCFTRATPMGCLATHT